MVIMFGIGISVEGTFIEIICSDDNCKRTEIFRANTKFDAILQGKEYGWRIVLNQGYRCPECSRKLGLLDPARIEKYKVNPSIANHA